MKIFKWIALIILWIIIGLIISNYSSSDNFINEYILQDSYDNINYYVDKYNRFEVVDNILKKQYYDYENIDHDVMTQNALKAYVDWIGDPYTVYMDAEENSWFIEDLEWQSDFEWIGAVVSKKDYYILIEEIIKDAPAYKAWLKPLDRIVKIDDEYVQDETLNESVNRMRWPKWTRVNIAVERVNWDTSEIIEFSVVRDTIDVPSLTTKILNIDGKNIWYIEISMVWEETENIFKKQIPELVAANLSWIIVDLRWNGWWLMNIAVQIASHFIPKWRIIVKSKYEWFTDEIYDSKWYGEFEWLKTVVLVDWLTASAWEIIALALQEQANATIVGTTTFGKWTIQTLHDFKNGDSLKYTIWKWFPPSDISIDQIWIRPDIVVDFDYTWYVNDDIDNQLEEAKSLFQ